LILFEVTEIGINPFLYLILTILILILEKNNNFLFIVCHNSFTSGLLNVKKYWFYNYSFHRMG